MLTRPLVLAFGFATSLALLPAAGLAEDPTLSVSLRDQEANAHKRGASVVATVTGLKLVDPGQPQAGQGHLHYRLDGGPVIATTATKVGFHELTPGSHSIEVALAGNDHKPLGPKQTVKVEIPMGGPTHTKQPANPPASPAPMKPAPSSPPPVGVRP
jgi:hypothetical protein